VTLAPRRQSEESRVRALALYGGSLEGERRGGSCSIAAFDVLLGLPPVHIHIQKAAMTNILAAQKG
ncbi:hypothetical protein Trydic_g9932, partial [Trypoxylus dichotomus]